MWRRNKNPRASYIMDKKRDTNRRVQHTDCCVRVSCFAAWGCLFLKRSSVPRPALLDILEPPERENNYQLTDLYWSPTTKDHALLIALQIFPNKPCRRGNKSKIEEPELKKWRVLVLLFSAQTPFSVLAAAQSCPCLALVIRLHVSYAASNRKRKVSYWCTLFGIDATTWLHFF